MSKFKGAIARTKAKAKKHAPEIMVAVGVANIFISIGLAIDGTRRATKAINEKREIISKAEHKPVAEVTLTKKEVVKTTAKYYVPTAISAVLATSCVIGANRENRKRNAILASAYTLSETARKELRQQIVETFGEKKAQLVDDELAKKKLEQVPVANPTNIIDTGDGTTLCYDEYTDRYFYSSPERIKQNINKLNERLLTEHWIPLNDYYYINGIGIIKDGDEKGWNLDRDGLISPSFSSILDKNDRPCLVIGFLVGPRLDYIS